MNDQDHDYLWDKRGPVDPEVARLEELLGGFRARPGGRPVRRRAAVAVVVAALAMAAAAAFFLISRGDPGWRVDALAGAPRCGLSPCAKLRPGQWLETAAGDRARVAVADIGQLDVEPGTRLRLVRTSPTEHRLQLARGTISARVKAPPRLLVVDTPTAAAVDLGCSYLLTVDDDGGTRIEVTAGWVALESPARTVYVTAGTAARTRAGAGPGTPVRVQAPASLRAAVDQLDADPGDAAALASVLTQAERHDAITLWHLITLVPAGGPRGQVMARLEALAGRPQSCSSEAAGRLDPTALDTWRDAVRGPFVFK